MKFPKRQNSGRGGPSNYLKIKDGESVTGIVAGKIHKYYQVGFGRTAQIVGPGEGPEKFRANFVVKDGDAYVAKVWDFGPKIYDILTALEESGWDMDKTLLTISRVGTTRDDTKWTVAPNKKEPTAAALKEIAKLALNQLEPKPFQNEIEKPAVARDDFAGPDDDDGDIPF